eukprot:1041988-Prorocentrum_minimum.AAC.1
MAVLTRPGAGPSPRRSGTPSGTPRGPSRSPRQEQKATVELAPPRLTALVVEGTCMEKSTLTAVPQGHAPQLCPTPLGGVVRDVLLRHVVVMLQQEM